MCLTITLPLKIRQVVLNERDRLMRRDLAMILMVNVAKEDITVYKYLQYGMVSPYWGYQYALGYHYYQNGPVQEHFSGYLSGSYNYISIYRGLHAYTSLKAIRRTKYPDIIVECTIPRGALYYVNEESGEICSNELIINRIVK